MADVVFLCPQPRDRLALARLASEGCDVAFVGDDLESALAVDLDALVRECAAHRPRSVVATKDRSALLAALVCERLGLGGPTPAALLRCQHKLHSRSIQQAVVPTATPSFSPVGAIDELTFPCFVKPVVGRLSDNAILARGPGDLTQLQTARPYAREYAALAAHGGANEEDYLGYIAEEVLTGAEVTLEGFVRHGAVEVLGITDSINYPGTSSFERFEYPTALSQSREGELVDVATTLVPALGLDESLFNIEFFVPEGGAAKIVEINARMASQFAPLLAYVHGRSSYDVLLRLAMGDEPCWTPRSPKAFALSYCLRVFDDAMVERVPPAAGDTEILVAPGEVLSRQGTNDVGSYRLCIFVQTGPDRQSTVAAARRRAGELRGGFSLRPLDAALG